MANMKGQIYKITNPKGFIYIGQTTKLDIRKKAYEACNIKGQLKIKNSIKKYGWETHIFEVIEECEYEILNEKEIFWIDFYKSNKYKYPENGGLNLTNGGAGVVGNKWSEEAKKRQSEKTKGKNTWSKGKKLSEEHIEKLKGKTPWNKGKTLTEEHINKLKLAKIGYTTWNKGKSRFNIEQILEYYNSGVSQRDIAKLLNTDAGYISKIINGKRLNDQKSI